LPFHQNILTTQQYATVPTTAESHITDHKKIMILYCCEVQPGLVYTSLSKAVVLPEPTDVYGETCQLLS